MIGHNGGPSVAAGESWRLTCWRKARADLLPTLPIEVVRTRVARARALGLDYRTYASVRAATGHDVVAFLFSSNALRVMPQRPAMPQDRAAKLAEVQAGRIGLAVAPLSAGLMAAANPVLDRAAPAPAPLARWAEARTALRGILGPVPGDRVVLVGDLTLEADWAQAGRLAAYLPADRYFGAAPALAFADALR